MKFISKSIMLLMVLLVASACSSAFETAGLSADDAAMLSVALATNPATEAIDFNYSVNISVSAEGQNMNVTTTGRGISDPVNGNSLLSMAGEVSGVPDMGGETLPYDLEVRTLNGTDVYVRGLAGMMDPSMAADQWLFFDSSTATQMAPPELQSTGVMSGGEVDFAGIYDTINASFLGSTANYLEAVRVDDMDGLAHYTVNLDLADWVASDELQAGLEAMIPALVGDAVPQEELEASMSQLAMLPMLGMFFSDSNFQFDYFVDPADGSLASAMVTIDMTIDPATMGQEGEAVVINFVLDVDMNEFSADSVVAAPENFIDPMASGS